MCSAAGAAAPAAPRPRPARWAFAGGPDAAAKRITTEFRERIDRQTACTPCESDRRAHPGPDRYNHPRPRTVLTLGVHTGRTNGGLHMGADNASPSMTRRVLLTAGGLTVLGIYAADPAGHRAGDPVGHRTAAARAPDAHLSPTRPA